MANNKEKKEKYIEFESIKQGVVKKVFKPENSKITYARKQQSYISKDEQKFLQLLIQQQQQQQQQHQQQTKLLKIYEQYEENKIYYTVQEYCKKGNIRDKICEMKIDDIEKLILDLGEQLEFIHNHKYVFMDLKPENILISDDGIFKLCDFGSIQKIKLDQSVSIVDSRAGSDSYMPHDKVITMNFDIYSFGVIIYELYSHFKLFDDKQQVKSYFDREFDEIIIKYQYHLLIDEIEKIFILLMIDIHELNRPDIQQVNLFFKSDDINQKRILLSQLEKQKKYKKLLKIQFEINLNSIFSKVDQQLKQNIKQTDNFNKNSSKIIQIKNIYNRGDVSAQQQLSQLKQLQNTQQQQYIQNQQEVQQQQQEINKQKEDLHNLQNQQEENQQLLKQLKQQCEELREQTKIDEESLNILRDEYQDLSTKQSNQKESIEEVKQQNKELQEQLEINKQNIQQLKTDKQTLKEQQIFYEKECQYKVNLQLQINQLREKCDKIREQILIDENEKQQYQNLEIQLLLQNRQLNSEKETKQFEIIELQQKSKTFDKQIQDYKVDIEKLTYELQQQESQFEILSLKQAELQNKIQSYVATIEEITVQLGKQQDQLEIQKQESEQLKTQRNVLYNQLNIKKSENIYFQTQIDDIKKQIKINDEEIEKRKSEISELQENLNKRQLQQTPIQLRSSDNFQNVRASNIVSNQPTKYLSPIQNGSAIIRQQIQVNQQQQNNQNKNASKERKRNTQPQNPRNKKQYLSRSQPSLDNSQPIQISTQNQIRPNFKIQPRRQPLRKK